MVISSSRIDPLITDHITRMSKPSSSFPFLCGKDSPPCCGQKAVCLVPRPPAPVPGSSGLWAPTAPVPGPPHVLLLPSVLGGPSTVSASGRHTCSPRVGQIQPVTDQPARAAPCIPHCYTFSLIPVRSRNIQLMSAPSGAGCALSVLLSECTVPPTPSCVPVPTVRVQTLGLGCERTPVGPCLASRLCSPFPGLQGPWAGFP